MTTERTVAEVIDLMKTCKSVESINQWNDRHYLNLYDASRTFRGDQTAKWFIDKRGIINHEPGKGTRSDGFRDSIETLNEFAAQNDIEIRKVI